MCHMNQLARIRRPCLLLHYRFHSYYKSTIEETALTHKDEGRTDCLAGKEIKGVWSSLEKTASCSMGKRMWSNPQRHGTSSEWPWRGWYKDNTSRTLIATIDGATDLTIHSPDTDVLVLAIRIWSSEMCLNTSFITGRGASHQSIKLRNPHLYFTPSQEPIILVASQGRERYHVGKHF